MNSETVKGFWYSVAAYVLWGFLPIYWKHLSSVPSAEILSHRIIWSFALVMMILVVSGHWRDILAVLRQRQLLIRLAVASVLISINWFTYIWAVNHDHIVEASLGYYINPLFSVLLGMTFLHEKMSRLQWAAVAIAAIGTIVLAVEYGHFPWIALLLAASFGLYGLVKKVVRVDPLVGLAYETSVMVPISLVYLVYLQWNGTGALGHAPLEIELYLWLAGIATTLPLLWFANGAQRIPLSMLGFIQFLSPTISLFLGVFVFHEPFTKAHLISFSLIWLAIALYTVSKVSFPKPKHQIQA